MSTQATTLSSTMKKEETTFQTVPTAKATTVVPLETTTQFATGSNNINNAYDNHPNNNKNDNPSCYHKDNNNPCCYNKENNDNSCCHNKVYNNNSFHTGNNYRGGDNKTNNIDSLKSGTNDYISIHNRNKNRNKHGGNKSNNINHSLEYSRNNYINTERRNNANQRNINYLVKYVRKNNVTIANNRSDNNKPRPIIYRVTDSNTNPDNLIAKHSKKERDFICNNNFYIYISKRDNNTRDNNRI
uniref:Uncharacterized protein n=1 Tax=Branchiostoma floridae TaxID=7739 RepID=C3YBX6_BRAFL|eukprot:XP_002606141.1 hypothetical protein BRAFLDRAFT_102740 [Branchiostoma floridae]